MVSLSRASSDMFTVGPRRRTRAPASTCAHRTSSLRGESDHRQDPPDGLVVLAKHLIGITRHRGVMPCNKFYAGQVRRWHYCVGGEGVGEDSGGIVMSAGGRGVWFGWKGGGRIV